MLPLTAREAKIQSFRGGTGNGLPAPLLSRGELGVTSRDTYDPWETETGTTDLLGLVSSIPNQGRRELLSAGLFPSAQRQENLRNEGRKSSVGCSAPWCVGQIPDLVTMWATAFTNPLSRGCRQWVQAMGTDNECGQWVRAMGVGNGRGQWAPLFYRRASRYLPQAPPWPGKCPSKHLYPSSQTDPSHREKTDGSRVWGAG